MNPAASRAYHEAGHMSIALLYNRAFHSGSIIPDSDSGGRVMFAEDSPPFVGKHSARVFYGESFGPDIKADNFAARMIRIHCAGAAAESLFLGSRRAMSRSDLRNAANMAAFLCSDWKSARRLIREHWRVAEELLVENWICVDTIARALLAYQSISEAEAKHIYEAASRSSQNLALAAA